MVLESNHHIGFKKTDIGKIPSDWEAIKLDDVSSLMTNGFVGTATPYYTDSENGIKYLYGKNVRNNYIDEDGIRWITPLFHNKIQKSSLKEGDLLTVQSGHIGTTCVVPKSLEGSNCHALIITRIAEMAPTFVSYYLNSDLGMERLSLIFVGSTIKHINVKDFKRFKIPHPPLPEQKKIAYILSSVDEAIQASQKVIEQTQKVKKGLLQELLTKGIGHTEFKKTEIGEIPVEWEVSKGEEVSSKITKGASPKWQGFDYQESGTLFITSENVRDGYLSLAALKFLPLTFNEKQKNSQLMQNDILINIVGASIGRSCIYTSKHDIANINQAVCVMRLKSHVISKYISYYLQSDLTISRLLETQAGSARQNLSLANIRDFYFPIPPISEQKAIVALLSGIDNTISLSKDKYESLLKLKKGLMQDLLTGKVRVNV